ncbi:alpha carbonic anhydrase [Syncephalis fuscata]|nr:alpha carbonic anhydrase [Syncephalis fuscata]
MKLSIVALYVIFTGAVMGSDGAEWSYEGSRGPAKWGELSADYSKCGNGKHQSPINLVTPDAERLTRSQRAPPSFTWKRLEKISIVNNGHTIQMDLDAQASVDNYLTYNNVKYALQNIHFHAPSEHRISGAYYEAEAHFVHKAANGQLLVVGTFLQVSTHNNNLVAPIIQNIPKNKGDKKTVPSLDLPGILKTTDNLDTYWTYSGSLTTPPCSENVFWFVSAKEISISISQYHDLRSALGFSSRYTQPR